MGHKETIYQGILDGDREAVVAATKAALGAKTPAGDVLNEAMIPAMAEVGRLFEINEYYVPELLIAARAMQAGLDLLKPELVAEGVEPKGKVVVGTVKGDLHDIGKNLVAIMVEGAFGWSTWASTFARKYVQTAIERRRRHRHVGPADHHHAQHEGHGRGSQRVWYAWQDQDHDRRRPSRKSTPTRSAPTAMVAMRRGRQAGEPAHRQVALDECPWRPCLSMRAPFCSLPKGAGCGIMLATLIHPRKASP